MSEIVLSQNLMPITQENVQPASNTRDNHKSSSKSSERRDSARAEEIPAERGVERNTPETDVAESKNEDFQKVLEKRISKESGNDAHETKKEPKRKNNSKEEEIVKNVNVVLVDFIKNEKISPDKAVKSKTSEVLNKKNPQVKQDLSENKSVDLLKQPILTEEKVKTDKNQKAQEIIDVPDVSKSKSKNETDAILLQKNKNENAKNNTQIVEIPDHKPKGEINTTQKKSPELLNEKVVTKAQNTDVSIKADNKIVKNAQQTKIVANNDKEIILPKQAENQVSEKTNQKIITTENNKDESINLLQIQEKQNKISIENSDTKQQAFQMDKQSLQSNLKNIDIKNKNKVESETATKLQNEVFTNEANKTASETLINTSGQQNIISSVSNTKGNTSGVSGSVDSISQNTLNPAQQVIQNINSNPLKPEQEVVITLNPPELGRVKISFQQNAGEISGVLEVEKAETAKEIEKALPQIVASLQENGIALRKIDLVQTGNQQNNQNSQKYDMPDSFKGDIQQDFTGDTENNKSSGNYSKQDDASKMEQSFSPGVVQEISEDKISAYA